MLRADEARASVAGRLGPLPAPPSRGAARRWLVPVEFISRALALVYDGKLDLRKPSRLVVVGDVRVPRLTFRYDPLGASGRLTIDATPRALATITQDGDHLTIKFDADALDTSNPPMPPQSPQSLVLAVRLVDATTSPWTSVAFAASGAANPWTGDAAGDRHPGEDRRAARSAATIGTAATAAGRAAGAQPAAFGIRTVAIGPGHGSDDGGSHGAGGAKEKDLTLAIAARGVGVEARLGIRVLLTRGEIGTCRSTSGPRSRTTTRRISSSACTRTVARNTTAGAASSAPNSTKQAHPPRRPAPIACRPSAAARATSARALGLAQTRHRMVHDLRRLLEQQLHDHIPWWRVPWTARAAHARVSEHAAVLIEMGYLTSGSGEAAGGRCVPERARAGAVRRDREIP